MASFCRSRCQVWPSRVQVVDTSGTPLPGMAFADCKPITRDSLNAPIEWNSQTLSQVREKPVQLQFSIRNASLFAFELTNDR